MPPLVLNEEAVEGFIILQSSYAIHLFMFTIPTSSSGHKKGSHFYLFPKHFYSFLFSEQQQLQLASFFLFYFCDCGEIKVFNISKCFTLPCRLIPLGYHFDQCWKFPPQVFLFCHPRLLFYPRFYFFAPRAIIPPYSQVFLFHPRFSLVFLYPRLLYCPRVFLQRSRRCN